MAKKTVLVVDDEEKIRTSTKALLEKNGYRVITAINGDDCLKKLQKEKVDLILLDIMMPGTPIKDIVPKIKGVKIAFLTAVIISEAEKEEITSSKNIVDYIRKPFDIAELLKKVKKYT